MLRKQSPLTFSMLLPLKQLALPLVGESLVGAGCTVREAAVAVSELLQRVCCASVVQLVLRAVAVKDGAHRASTGATDLVANLPSQVRLSTGVPLPAGDLALYHSLEVFSAKPTSPASPLLQSAKTNRTQLEVKQSPALACVLHENRKLGGSPGPTGQHDFHPSGKQEAYPDKENMLMGVDIPRFNMIEARHTFSRSSALHVSDVTLRWF